MRSTGPAYSALRSFARPSIRNRRTFTSSFFWATFLGAIVTVSLSASNILPCPAKTRQGQFRRELDAFEGKDRESTTMLGEGERIKLTRKGGWIEIDDAKPRETSSRDSQ